MRYIFFISILTIFLSTLGTKNSCQHKQSYTIPKSISLDKLYINHNPAISHSPYGYVSDSFYPIGWSLSGIYFAYIIESHPGAASPPEGYNFQMFIKDATNDSIAWNWSLKNESQFNNYDHRIVYIEEIWAKYKKIFSKSLRNYDIIQLWNNNLLIKLPATINQIRYDAKVAKTMGISTLTNSPEIKAEKVIFSMNGLGNKTVFNRKYEKFGIRNSSVVGLILSPFSRKSVLLKITESRGWEGPPHKLSIELIGCDLINL